MPDLPPYERTYLDLLCAALQLAPEDSEEEKQIEDSLNTASRRLSLDPSDVFDEWSDRVFWGDEVARFALTRPYGGE